MVDAAGNERIEINRGTAKRKLKQNQALIHRLWIQNDIHGRANGDDGKRIGESHDGQQNDPGKKPREIGPDIVQQAPDFAGVFNVRYRFHPFISTGHKFPTLGSRWGEVKSWTYPDRGARLSLHSL